MVRFILLLVACFFIAGCTLKSPPPARDYKLEALHNEVRQVEIFIDNWSGYQQKYSRINSLDEYKSVRQKILASPAYQKLSGKERFEGKLNQFDAVVKRYEIWVEERATRLKKMERFVRDYQASQKRIFSQYAKPLVAGAYELVVENSYYLLEPDDPDKAYASARYVGLSQLNIIAASKDQPLRLPRLAIKDFVVEIKISNRSNQKILRPDGFTVQRQSKISKGGSPVSRSRRQYLVNFSDDIKNRYQFAQAVGVTNKNSENGIRPGDSVTWTYHFSRENHPVETVRTFHVIYPARVFGHALRLNIPLQAIRKPKLSESYRAG